MSESAPLLFPESKRADLQRLVDQFRGNIAQYKGPSYDESNTRTDFIDKFFEVLGWDVRNDRGRPEQHCEVVREDRILVGNWSKYLDYSFRIGG